jgi:hypothetical protein
MTHLQLDDASPRLRAHSQIRSVRLAGIVTQVQPNVGDQVAGLERATDKLNYQEKLLG